jgi:hypothetical protein
VSGCVCAPSEPKVAYPTPLEAILRAKKAFNAILEACRTLKCARIVSTIQPRALSFLFRCLVHGRNEGRLRLVRVCEMAGLGDA